MEEISYLKIKSEVYSLMMNSNPTYWVKKDFLRKLVIKDEKGESFTSYIVTEKGFEALKNIAKKKLWLKKQSNNFKQAIKEKREINLFSIAGVSL